MSPNHFVFLILLLYSSRAGQQNSERGRTVLEICCCYMCHQLSRVKGTCQPRTKLKNVILYFCREASFGKESRGVKFDCDSYSKVQRL